MTKISRFSLGKIVGQIVQYIFLVIAAFSSLLPIVSCITTAFKSGEEYNSTSVMIPPENWLNFENFKVAWNEANMGRAFLNTFIILIFVLFGRKCTYM